MAKAKQITAEEALKFFKGAKISVQHARRVKKKGEDGVEREAFETKSQDLSEAGILSAADYGDRVVIVTIDGKRYEAAK